MNFRIMSLLSLLISACLVWQRVLGDVEFQAIGAQDTVEQKVSVEVSPTGQFRRPSISRDLFSIELASLTGKRYRVGILTHHNRYLSHNGNSLTSKAHSSQYQLSPQEVFTIFGLEGNTFALQASNGGFISFHPGGDGGLANIGTVVPLGWETLTFEDAGNNRVAIKSSFGTYLRAWCCGGIDQAIHRLDYESFTLTAVPLESYDMSLRLLLPPGVIVESEAYGESCNPDEISQHIRIHKKQANSQIIMAEVEAYYAGVKLSIVNAHQSGDAHGWFGSASVAIDGITKPGQWDGSISYSQPRSDTFWGATVCVPLGKKIEKLRVYKVDTFGPETESIQNDFGVTVNGKYVQQLQWSNDAYVDIEVPPENCFYNITDNFIDTLSDIESYAGTCEENALSAQEKVDELREAMQNIMKFGDIVERSGKIVKRLHKTVKHVGRFVERIPKIGTIFKVVMKKIKGLADTVIRVGQIFDKLEEPERVMGNLSTSLGHIANVSNYVEEWSGYSHMGVDTVRTCSEAAKCVFSRELEVISENIYQKPQEVYDTTKHSFRVCAESVIFPDLDILTFPSFDILDPLIAVVESIEKFISTVVGGAMKHYNYAMCCNNVLRPFGEIRQLVTDTVNLATCFVDPALKLAGDLDPTVNIALLTFNVFLGELNKIFGKVNKFVEELSNLSIRAPVSIQTPLVLSHEAIKEYMQDNTLDYLSSLGPGDGDGRGLSNKLGGAASTSASSGTKNDGEPPENNSNNYKEWMQIALQTAGIEEPKDVCQLVVDWEFKVEWGTYSLNLPRIPDMSWVMTNPFGEFGDEVAEACKGAANIFAQNHIDDEFDCCDIARTCDAEHKVILYEGNKCRQNIAGTLGHNDTERWKTSEKLCLANDEARSVKFQGPMKAGFRLDIGDDSDELCSDDSTSIVLMRDLNEWEDICIDSFELSGNIREHEYTDYGKRGVKIYHNRFNGLDGKASQYKISNGAGFEKPRCNFPIAFYEEENCIGDIGGYLDKDETCDMCTFYNKFKNDFTSSFSLIGPIKAGRFFEFSDNRDDNCADDFATAYVHTDIPAGEFVCVNTLEENGPASGAAGKYVKQSFSKANGLKGKVSKISSYNEKTTMNKCFGQNQVNFYEGNFCTEQVVSNGYVISPGKGQSITPVIQNDEAKSLRFSGPLPAGLTIHLADDPSGSGSDDTATITLLRELGNEDYLCVDSFELATWFLTSVKEDNDYRIDVHYKNGLNGKVSAVTMYQPAQPMETMRVLKGQRWSEKFSEEGLTHRDFLGNTNHGPITGWHCEGSACDNKHIRQATASVCERKDVAVRTDLNTLSIVSNTPSVRCAEDEYIGKIMCYGSKCGLVSIGCIKLHHRCRYKEGTTRQKTLLNGDYTTFGPYEILKSLKCLGDSCEHFIFETQELTYDPTSNLNL